jgi:hypothetical protein
LRRRRLSYVFIEATLPLQCPADALEIALVATQRGAAGAELAPWMKDRTQAQTAPLTNRVLRFPEGAPLRERVLVFVPRELPAELDVYLRYKDADRYKKELETAAERLAAFGAQAAFDGPRRELAIRRVAPVCPSIVTALADTGATMRPALLSIAEPVALAGRLGIHPDGRVTFEPGREDRAKLREALLSGLCEAFPERCELARGAAGARP